MTRTTPTIQTMWAARRSLDPRTLLQFAVILASPWVIRALAVTDPAITLLLAQLRLWGGLALIGGLAGVVLRPGCLDPAMLRRGGQVVMTRLARLQCVLVLAALIGPVGAAAARQDPDSTARSGQALSTVGLVPMLAGPMRYLLISGGALLLTVGLGLWAAPPAPPTPEG